MLNNTVHKQRIFDVIKHANRIADRYTDRYVTNSDIQGMFTKLKKIGIIVDDNSTTFQYKDDTHISMSNYCFEKHTNEIYNVIGSHFIMIKYIINDSVSKYLFHFS